MRFAAPNESRAHQALIEACTRAGYKPLDLRRLLWLMNAHPELVAHGRVFSNLSEVFRIVCLHLDRIGLKAELQDLVPSFQRITHWISTERRSLSQIGGLEELELAPTHERHHPILRRGVTRHAIPAAMWNRHQSAHEYPIPLEMDTARKYLVLQAEVFLAYIDARYHSNPNGWEAGLAHYEAYSDPDERPTAPTRTTEVGLAIREFSESRYDGLISTLPLLLPLEDYAEQFIALVGPRSSSNERSIGTAVGSDTRARTARYLQAIHRYLSRYLAWRRRSPEAGRRPTKSSGGAGGHRLRPGYVHFGSESDTLFELTVQEPNDDDPDLPNNVVTTNILINYDLEKVTPAALESQGLSPAETLEPTLELCFPEVLGARIAKLRHQQLAIDMAAQRLPFNNLRPTPTELRSLHRLLNSRLHAWFLKGEKSQHARAQPIAALILLTSLVLGIPLERARSLRRRFVGEPVTTETDDPTLILARPEAQAAWQVVGFEVAALSPTYRTEVDIDPRARNIVLPDELGIGSLIARFEQTDPQGSTSNRLFRIQHETLRRAAADLLLRIPSQRLTTLKIAATLPSILYAQGADATEVDLLTGNAKNSNEPRLFYTQISIERLQRTYLRAIRRLAREIEAPLRDTKVQGTKAPVGARSIASIESVRGLVKTLRHEIRDTRMRALDMRWLAEYHASFVLFAYIYQGCSTSIRAVTSPRANMLFDSASANDFQAGESALSDKDTVRTTRARLALISSSLAEQLKNYQQHIAALLRLYQPRLMNRQPLDAVQPFVVFDERRQLTALTPSWVERECARRGFALPANFHRGLLRTELLKRGLFPELIDALLGHANAGELPFGQFSTFDFGAHRRSVTQSLDALHRELGLRPLRSRLVHQHDVGH
ncbi:MAG TPA: hypothetical protein PLN31_03345 [Azoarcus taiwanensis]|nr:hypothetical protein [Azoarcus taiwanensis]